MDLLSYVIKIINQVDQLSGYIYKVDQIGKNNSANALIFYISRFK